MAQIDGRNAVLGFSAFLMLIVGIIVFANNADEDPEVTLALRASFGILAAGGCIFLAFLINCLGITNSDEKELFGENANRDLAPGQNNA